MGTDSIVIRDASRDDVARIVALYRTDELGQKHPDAGDAIGPGYFAAFDAIAADPRNRLLVAVSDGVLAGSFQLTYIPDMNAEGSEVALIENVIVDGALRSRGIGSAMMGWAIDQARARGCYRVSLLSRNTRTDAHRFYARLGFEASSAGFKLYL